MKGNIMRKLLVICLMVMFMMPLRANAFSWSDFFAWLFGGTTTETTITSAVLADTSKQMDTIKTKSSELDSAVKTLFLDIVAQLSTPTEAKAIETQANTDLFKAITDYQTTINNEKARVLITIKTMTDKEKETLSKNVKTFYSLGEKYSDMYKEATSAKNTISRGTITSTEHTEVINKVNSVVTETSNKANAVNNLSVIIKTYARLTGLKIQ